MWDEDDSAAAHQQELEVRQEHEEFLARARLAHDELTQLIAEFDEWWAANYNRKLNHTAQRSTKEI